MFDNNTYDGDTTYEDGKQYKDDDKLFVKFFTKPLHNESRSTKEGRPVFDEVEYISIITPGSRDIFTTPLEDNYKRRFKKRYEGWLANKDATKVEGTLLAEMAWLTQGQIAELNYSNVFTIEQLANLSDTNARQFLGNFKLRERAKLYLEQAAGDAPLLRLQAELEERDMKIEVLSKQMTDLQAAFEKMTAEKQRK